MYEEEEYSEARDVIDLRKPSPEPGQDADDEDESKKKKKDDKPKRIIKRNPIATLNPAR